MRRLLVISGPTAVGKTDLALALARQHPLRLISADSQQVYRGMDIGTAKPGLAERSRFALMDVAQPGDAFSAGDFCRLAAPLVQDAWDQGLCPCLVGGTGLYLKALLDGLAAVPSIPAKVRQGLEAELAQAGLPAMAARLTLQDPVLAARSDLKNPRRVLRGLEVALATGQALSAWQAQAPGQRLEAERLLWLGLQTPDPELKSRIALRTRASLSSGWPGEALALRQRYGDQAVLRSRPIGYAEVFQLLDGELSLEAAAEAITLRTWAYARRQKTWFRKAPVSQWLSPAGPLPDLKGFFA